MSIKARIFDAAGDLWLYWEGPDEDQLAANVPAGGHSEPIPDATDLFTLPVLPRKGKPSPPPKP